MFFQGLIFCVFWTLAVGSVTGKERNERPIIGILAQESSPSYKKYGRSYIAASYVKYVESAGGRVVPILVNQTDQYYEYLFNSTNGVLFPGGDIDIVYDGFGYSHSAHMFYKLAISANKRGDYYPIWGTCLGFEELMIQTAGKDLLKHGINSHDTSLPVNLVSGYEKSRLLNAATTPKSIVSTLASENSTYNNHKLALTMTNFSKSAALQSFYQVLSTNHDANGVEFISMVEGFDYPVYGTQWHPEKNAFEWKVNACHNLTCVQLMQFMADFLVEEARKSMHHFSSAEEESKYLIYRYQPVDLHDMSASYEQSYYF